MRDELTRQLYHLKSDLLGTCDDPMLLADQLSLDISREDLDGRLGEIGCESCAGCHWWFNSSELHWYRSKLLEGYLCHDCNEEYLAKEAEMRQAEEDAERETEDD